RGRRSWSSTTSAIARIRISRKSNRGNSENSNPAHRLDGDKFQPEVDTPDTRDCRRALAGRGGGISGVGAAAANGRLGRGGERVRLDAPARAAQIQSHYPTNPH